MTLANRGALALAFLAALSGCGGSKSPTGGAGSASTELHIASGRAFGTGYTIKTATPVDTATHDAVQATLATIDASMSTYRDDSEISQFNSSEDTAWFPVSPDFVTVVKTARAVSEATGGALDITAAPLFRLWAADKTAEPPADLALANARLHINFHNIATATSPPALRKNAAGTTVDVSAVAKGHAVDAVAALLDGAGHTSYMVEIGGEVRTRGTKPDGDPFRIGIEKPVPGPRAVLTSVPLTDACMATSGDYRNYFVHDGKHYSHVVDPRTGKPVDHDLASVTVVTTDTTARADALATALLVMGPDSGYAFATEHDLAALFVQRAADGSTAEKTTPAFDALSGEPTAAPATSTE